ncbi:hypothetical protein HNR08_003826 [Cellulomonas hominis]|uniref:Uncharacterized protein n=1 Tax=Cellulomonas hominis TaxID=156981 RepID=A0A7W8SH98_9CELL|nr:hypothetical protein [Cellulomonas hominis]MBB5475090.1 hypothetical protein [Cellulomonas hominis]
MTSSDAPLTGWRRGSRTRPVDEVVEHLLDAASHHGRAAIRAVTSKDEFVLLDGAFHVGAAVELAAKAAVAETEPMLLSSAGNTKGEMVDTLARFRPGVNVAPVPGGQRRRLRTIDASVAVAVVARLYPKCNVSVELPLDVRNDAVHLAVVDPDRLTEAVRAMVVYVTLVVEAIELPPALFWRDEANEALSLQTQRVRRLLKLAKRRVVLAKQAFELRLDAIEQPEGRDALVRQLERLRPAFDETVEHPCPACGYSAALGWTSDVDVERDPDGGYYVAFAGLSFEGLECPVCDLKLNAEETEALGIDGTWEPPEPEVDFADVLEASDYDEYDPS